MTPYSFSTSINPSDALPDQKGILTKKIVDKITEYYNKYGVMFRRIVTEPIDISSTQIRKRIADGKDISGLVPKKVEDFIYKNALYRGKGDS